MKAGNKQKRVLLVMSSVDEMGISGKQTGTWFTELAAPYYILTEAGFEVVFATPAGGAAPIDLLSMKAPFTTEHTQRFFNDPVAMFAATHTRKLREIDHSTFDAVFFPGGYGLLWDLASDSHVVKLIREFYESDRARCEADRWTVSGRRTASDRFQERRRHRDRTPPPPPLLAGG